ncbi:Ser/Thr protein kinase RdoA involved in Cpx stress response, MazF antagonist [Paenibacillus sp. 1_12]|uniref:phosphotransferase enzyme family protein n=1 Tax=Paenibacillus sp. 1_12 TaxID=1566278 RepID=UPI0008E8E0A6|nr:phosphotransferase [Paenibacillus sp. 1_12]SFM28267.1 Ser/Thr protein kinase RdoA involved in Cpx stress response, MazF antagonist [Paenibacillus sp. 1_12]
MTQDMKERWATEISVHLKDRFGLSAREILPIDKGWLNVKWKMVTDQGPIFVKYYHPERYKLNTRPERRRAIEKTLQLQHGLSVAGIACPMVYLYKGQFIQETPSGLFYTVLDWMDGNTVQAGCLNTAQMFELGVMTGRMHKWLRFVPPLDKPAWKPDRDIYLKEWQANWEKAKEAGDKTVMEWLRRSQAIVQSMDFHIFESCPTGWLHWDLWVDNILLHGQGLAGIVDFDRMTMAYQEIDVARAVLSGSLRDGQLRMDTTRAFMDGYRGYSEMSPGMLTRAMRLLYLIESIWWLRTEVRTESELSELLRRFVEEMHWIENNWAILSDLLETV